MTPDNVTTKSTPNKEEYREREGERDGEEKEEKQFFLKTREEKGRAIQTTRDARRESASERSGTQCAHAQLF